MSNLLSLSLQDVTNGYIFLTVSAQDDDRSSANNVLSFGFLSGNEKSKFISLSLKQHSYLILSLDHFSIHQASGQISVVSSLDRELQDR